VAVEKLALHEIAEIASRQEALQTIFPSLLDIFYHPIFDYYQKNRFFQQPQGHFPTVAIRFGPLALPGLLLLSIALGSALSVVSSSSRGDKNASGEDLADRWH